MWTGKTWKAFKFACFWKCGPSIILNCLHSVPVNSEAPCWLSSSGYNSLTLTTDHLQLSFQEILAQQAWVRLSFRIHILIFFMEQFDYNDLLWPTKKAHFLLPAWSPPLRGPSSPGRNLSLKDSLAWTSSEVVQEGLMLCPHSPSSPWDTGPKVPSLLQSHCGCSWPCQWEQAERVPSWWDIGIYLPQHLSDSL